MATTPHMTQPACPFLLAWVHSSFDLTASAWRWCFAALHPSFFAASKVLSAMVVVHQEAAFEDMLCGHRLALRHQS